MQRQYSLAGLHLASRCGPRPGIYCILHPVPVSRLASTSRCSPPALALASQCTEPCISAASARGGRCAACILCVGTTAPAILNVLLTVGVSGWRRRVGRGVARHQRPARGARAREGKLTTTVKTGKGRSSYFKSGCLYGQVLVSSCP